MAQTWYLNDTLNLLPDGTTLSGQFTTELNSDTFSSISFTLYNNIMYVEYINTIGQIEENVTLYHHGAYDDATADFVIKKLRTITYETAPSGETLTWLQANATIVPTDYLTTDVDLSKIADAIRAKTGSTDALVFPDGFVTAINNIPSGAYNITTTDNADGSQNLAIVDAGGSDELTPATLTINSESYTGNHYAVVMYVGTDGEIHKITSGTSFTFPLTINTVLGQGVSIALSGFTGTPKSFNVSGCTLDSYTFNFYAVPTATAASFSIEDISS